MAHTRQHVCFGVLCLSGPGALYAFARLYPASKSLQPVFFFIGFASTLGVFVWSILTNRRHPARSVFGLISCLLVFWLVLTIPGYIKAKEASLSGTGDETGALSSGE